MEWAARIGRDPAEIEPGRHLPNLMVRDGIMGRADSLPPTERRLGATEDRDPRMG